MPNATRATLICSAMLASACRAWATTPATPIQHVIIIMQENRSFDNYFGTYPGANGIPAGVCQPLALLNPSAGCVVPFHDVHEYNDGGPHTAPYAKQDLDNGATAVKMDAFAAVQAKLYPFEGTTCDFNTTTPPAYCYAPWLGALRHDVMGYHTAAEIPNYWSYAQNFRLHDMMFPTIRSYSTWVHTQMTSEWSATCSNPQLASTCTTSTAPPNLTPTTNLPWASLFQLLDAKGVSWKYYLGTGKEPDCDEDDGTCAPREQNSAVSGYWNPPPNYAYVRAQGAAYLAAHDLPVENFLADIKGGTLPAVSWIVPSADYSEHSPAGVTLGMNYVTTLINAVMQSPATWNSTVIFLAWDDWGGFYDHVPPPVLRPFVNGVPYGFGIRVPAITISPYLKQAGTVDHTIYSFDNYTKFIEDIFMGGARLNPAAFNNPDSRIFYTDTLPPITDIAGNALTQGDLMNAFDFTQTPLPPLVLPVNIPGGLTITCSNAFSTTCTNTSAKISWQGLGGTFKTAPLYTVTRDGVAVTGCTNIKTLSCVDTALVSGDHMYQVYSITKNAAGQLVTSAPSPVNEIVVP